MTIWRKHLQFINVMPVNRSSMIVAERGSGRMTYAKKIKPFAEHDLRVTLQRAGNNSLIRIDRKPIFYKSWFTKGIVFAKDLLKGNTIDFLSHAEIQSAFDININILDHLGIISAVKHLLRSCQRPLENANPSSQINLRTIFLQQQKPSKLVYKRIIQDKATEPKPS